MKSKYTVTSNYYWLSLEKVLLTLWLPVQILMIQLLMKHALKLVRDNTLLVLVDHANTNISGAPQLLARLGNRVVVIDHHRLAEQGLKISR